MTPGPIIFYLIDALDYSKQRHWSFDKKCIFREMPHNRRIILASVLFNFCVSSTFIA